MQCSVVGAVTGVFVPRIAHDQMVDDVAGFRRLVRTGFGFTMNICLAVMCYLLVFAEPVVLFVSGDAFAGAVTPVRIIGAVSLMSCVSYFVAMCILSPLGRERQMAMSSIAAAPVSVVLNLLLDGPFGAVGAGVALLATEATVLCIELWCARDVLSSFVRPLDLVRMAASNAVAVAVLRGLRVVARSRVLCRSRSDRDRGLVDLQRRRHRRRSGPARRHGPHAARKGPRSLAARVGDAPASDSTRRCSMTWRIDAC